jgi:hypothetical protein
MVTKRRSDFVCRKALVEWCLKAVITSRILAARHGRVGPHHNAKRSVREKFAVQLERGILVTCEDELDECLRIIVNHCIESPMTSELSPDPPLGRWELQTPFTVKLCYHPAHLEVMES